MCYFCICLSSHAYTRTRTQSTLFDGFSSWRVLLFPRSYYYRISYNSYVTKQGLVPLSGYAMLQQWIVPATATVEIVKIAALCACWKTTVTACNFSSIYRFSILFLFSLFLFRMNITLNIDAVHNFIVYTRKCQNYIILNCLFSIPCCGHHFIVLLLREVPFKLNDTMFHSTNQSCSISNSYLFLLLFLYDYNNYLFFSLIFSFQVI